MTYWSLPSESWKHKFFIFMGIVIGILRWFYCFRVPLCTTDILRNLGYGIEFWNYGPKIYDLTPEDFSPASYSILWPIHFYSYPAVTALFFAVLVKIWPSIVFGKLAITLLAGVNSILIRRLTQSPGLALLYWAHPIGIWFGSHEGQFEEMMVFWVLMAITALNKNRTIAYLYLALAIQTKLFPVFLIPYFLVKTYSSGVKNYSAGFGWFTLGMIPSMVFALTSQYLLPLFFAGYVPNYNAIPWEMSEFKFFPIQPFGIIFLHNLVGIAFITVFFYFMWRSKKIVPYFAALFFVFFVKYNQLAQPWYLLLTTSFCLTVEEEKSRRILFILSLAFGVDVLFRMFYPSFRFNNNLEVLILLKKNMYWIY